MLHALRRTLLLPILAAAPALHAQNAPTVQVSVTGAQIAALDVRLQSFAAGLPTGERRQWNVLLRRAASAAAPTGNASAIAVHQTLYRATPSNAIIVQGGLRPFPTRPTSAGVEAMGPKQDDPRAMGPKQDDPRAIGPKQDDPAPPPPQLLARLRSFSASLGTEDRATLDWLLTRAGASPLPSPVLGGNTPTLAQALGISPLAIGPKQDDPAPPPPPDTRWVLTF